MRGRGPVLFCFIVFGAAAATPLADDSKTLVESTSNTKGQHLVGLWQEAGVGGSCETVRVVKGHDGQKHAVDVSSLPVLRRRKEKGFLKGIQHVKASLLTVAVFGCLIRNLVSAAPLAGTTLTERWGLFAFFVVVYLMESATCSTRRYLSNLQTPAQVQDKLLQLQQGAPRVRWKVECFHFRDREGQRVHSAPTYWASRTKGGHHGSIPSGMNKHVTHRASHDYEFSTWKDATQIQETLDALGFDSGGDTDNKKAQKASTSWRQRPYLKISLSQMLVFLAASRHRKYIAEQDRFMKREGIQDDYMESWTFLNVDGFDVPKILAVRTGLGSMAHMRLPIFWMFTLLGLTVPYRYFFSRSCDEVDLLVTKEV